MQPDQKTRSALRADGCESFIRALSEKRRHNLPTRLISAGAIAMMNSGAIGRPSVLAWFIAYSLLQLAEAPLLAAVLRWRIRPKVQEALVLIFLAVSTLLFASLAIPLWLGPTWMGPAVAILMLVGAMGNAATVGRGMQVVFFVCFAPYFLLLITGPYFAAYAAHMHLRAALGVGPVVISLNILSSYWTGERLRKAEAKASAELEQKRVEAVAATDAKSRFVATVSHDLRTPLTAILACAGSIQRDAKDPREISRAGMIADAAMMMRCLLDDLLDLSKIEAGHMSVEVTSFDPRHLLDDVARFWSEEAARKGLTLTVSGTGSLPPLAGGDTIRIRQILNNLLSNAVKFTDAGGIMIETTAEPMLDGGYALSVSVVDTGVGLSEDQMAGLFTRFQQTDVSIARTHGGTGLGLAISRELARLLGGELTVQSRPGEGARFTMECTLAEVVQEVRRQDWSASNHVASSAPRILVVDDHELNRRALTLLLEPLGVVPILAEGGEEALAVLAHQAFDVILMDLNMVGLDGRETTIRLRASEGLNRNVPVIAVTGAVEPLMLQSCLESGMNAWVEKPLEPAALYAAIQRVLGGEAVDEAVAA